MSKEIEKEKKLQEEKERRRQEFERKERLKKQEQERKKQEFERKKRLEYWKNLMFDASISSLEKGRIFEEAMSELFERLGFRAELTRTTKDGGIDIVLYKNNEKYVVQCKFWKNNVGVEPIKQLWSDKDVYEATRAIMLTYSGISKDGNDYIAKINKKENKYTLYKHYDIYGIIELYERADKMNQ